MDRDLSDLDPELKTLCEKWLAECHAQGINTFITETYRSWEDQDADYASGRTSPGHIITNAQGGQSPHNCELEDGTPASQAFDFGIKNADGVLDWNAQDTPWQTAIAIGTKLGLSSGSAWHGLKDYPHFQLPDWKLSTDNQGDDT